MNEELEQEREHAKKLAAGLVEHLVTMDAATMALPVTVDGRNYEVTCAPEGMTESVLKLLELMRRYDRAERFKNRLWKTRRAGGLG